MKLPPPDPDVEKPFGTAEEEAIIPLAIDYPELFTPVANIIKPQMFKRAVPQYILAQILNIHEKHQIIPSRPLLRDIISKSLTADDPYEEVLELVDRESNPREVPIIKDTILQWAQNKAYGMLFNEESQLAYMQKNYKHLEGVIENARKLLDSHHRSFSFWDQYIEVFADDTTEHFSTGFRKLDKELNGGPSPGEVCVFLGATNVGKSIVLCNTVANNVLPKSSDPAARGVDTLLVSCEMADKKIAKRELGIFTGINLNDLKSRQDDAVRSIENLKARAGNFEIVEFPPDEANVDHIHAYVDQLKRNKGWAPKVIVLDYLDLLMSRVPSYNKEEYLRQKHVATEVRGLAKKLRIPIITATQTNRSGVDNETNITLNQVAESFGKTMPLDYIVSLNQTEQERIGVGGIPRIRFFIIKNRDGRKDVTIECSINYNNMQIREVQ